MVDWSTARPARSGEAWTRRHGTETAVFVDDSLHVLNASALAIWELCDGDTTAAEMVDAVEEVAGLEHARAEVDVQTALDELFQRKLIVVDGVVDGDEKGA